MSRYIIRRVLLMVPTALIAMFIVFLILRFLPGDTATTILGSEGIPYGTADLEQRIAGLRHELGLDKPVVTQFAHYIGGIFKGDLGKSFWTKEPVWDVLLERLPVTLELLVLSIVISAAVGITIGMLSAVRQDTVLDYLLRGITIFNLAVPIFWISVMLVLLPAIWLGWAPLWGYRPLFTDPLGNLKAFAIPALILGSHLAAPVMRVTRTAMLEVLRQDYIRTAHAKGLSELVVMQRHVLMNGLLPVVTLLGLQLAGGIGGAVIIENVFRLPGLGSVFLAALNQRDYGLIQGFNLFIVLFILVVNLIVDLSYGYLDPRTRVQ